MSIAAKGCKQLKQRTKERNEIVNYFLEKREKTTSESLYGGTLIIERKDIEVKYILSILIA